jgi:hypothetical protein
MLFIKENGYFSDYLPNWGDLFLYGVYVYLWVLLILNEFLTYRAHRAAPKMLRGIPESPMAEVASSPLPLRDAAA